MEKVVQPARLKELMLALSGASLRSLLREKVGAEYAHTEALPVCLLGPLPTEEWSRLGGHVGGHGTLKVNRDLWCLRTFAPTCKWNFPYFNTSARLGLALAESALDFLISKSFSEGHV